MNWKLSLAAAILLCSAGVFATMNGYLAIGFILAMIGFILAMCAGALSFDSGKSHD